MRRRSFHKLEMGRWISPAFSIVATLVIVVALTCGAAHARDLGSRLGDSAPAPTPTPSPTPAPAPAPVAPVVAEAVPVEELVLPTTGPLAADGSGRLLMAVSTEDGYAVLRRQDGGSTQFDTVYRRKGSLATALAVGPDGTFCIGLLTGLDCISPQGQIKHYEHDLLTNVLSIAFAPDGHLWILRTSGGGQSGLQLARATPGMLQVTAVLTLRQTILGFYGNGLAVTADGHALVSVIENETPRVLRVEPSGQFTRVADFWSLGGGITVSGTGTMYLAGVKRPQSLQEQRNPQDVVFAHPIGGTEAFAARFPLEPPGARFSSYMTLGGDGKLYLIRHQRVRVTSGPAQEMPVLWRVDVGQPAALGSRSRVIDFRIPFIGHVANPRMTSPDYPGPLLVGRGQSLVMSGVNFTGKQGQQRVLVGSVPAQIETWTDDQIVLRVPTTAAGGEAHIHVAIDNVTSDPEMIEVKTPDIPGWFQIGSPGLRASLDNNLAIVGYNAYITIDGVTDRGAKVQRTDAMETPGLYHVRLPNGQYSVKFSAAYVYSDVRYGNENQYVGSRHIPVRVPDQAYTFKITDTDPIVLWMPDMLGILEDDERDRMDRGFGW